MATSILWKETILGHYPSAADIRKAKALQVEKLGKDGSVDWWGDLRSRTQSATSAKSSMTSSDVATKSGTRTKTPATPVKSKAHVKRHEDIKQVRANVVVEKKAKHEQSTTCAKKTQKKDSKKTGRIDKPANVQVG